MAAARLPTLLTTAFVFLAVSSHLLSRPAADTGPECPYPCLPPPTSGGATYLPPPWGTGLPSTPPPPQPYTPGWLPPPSGTAYQPPSLQLPAPPPPNKIMPYFPYYFRTPNAAGSYLLKGGGGGGGLWLAAALSGSVLVHLFLH